MKRSYFNIEMYIYYIFNTITFLALNFKRIGIKYTNKTYYY